jgi:outer membrane receptor protein involved in Fe transport
MYFTRTIPIFITTLLISNRLRAEDPANLPSTNGPSGKQVPEMQNSGDKQPSGSRPATSSGDASASSGGNASTLPEVDVIAKSLDASRDTIIPELGATKYTLDSSQLQSQSQGEEAPFNSTLLRFPGMAQDSFGQLHVRGEHANLQYRINGVLIPEGISGFGQELSTRFVDNMSLITGALPAQYGFRTAGIVDVHTKSGPDLNGGEISIYGGSHDTITPSFEYGGTSGRLSYYFTDSFLHNGIGIENPTGGTKAIHDNTDQYKGFGYLSYIIDDTSRLSLLFSGTQSGFQIPNNPGQTGTPYSGVPSFDSANLNDRQTEANRYAILSYQKKIDDIDFQLSAFSRYSGVLFTPDKAGDLYFNGVASRVERNILTNGLQMDASWKINDRHTLRGGGTFTAESATENTDSYVFSVDGMGNVGTVPFDIADNSSKTGYLCGVYLQDEWKFLDKFTLNYGARLDSSDAYINESQLSPRVNLVWQPADKTTVHLGYARYFTPPPMELVSAETVSKFVGTTNANPDGITQSSPVRAERSNYFDLGATQQMTPDFQVGMDAYYKVAKNQLDEGQFGNALIYSPFNYSEGKVYGVEMTANYQKDGFSAYANVAYSHAMGKTITSGEFQFGQDELAYIANNWVFLDHDQRLTASLGASYSWERTKIYTDFISGTGLRKGFANTQQGQSYATVNTGIEHTLKLPHSDSVKLRFDIVNLFDQSYELRDGSGIGVGAPQFGARRGFYSGITYRF